MSTELLNIGQCSVTKFYGGHNHGVVIQITPLVDEFVTLNLSDAVKLRNVLSHYVYEEAVRRRDLLSEQIQELKNIDKTIFSDIAKLDTVMLQVPDISVQLIDKFCPKHKTSDTDAQDGVQKRTEEN